MDSEERNIIQRTENLTDEIKTICSNFGLGGASSEYKIITEVFLYKFKKNIICRHVYHSILMNFFIALAIVLLISGGTELPICI